MADLELEPDIRYLQPEEAGINRFAFVIHPLNVKFIHKHRCSAGRATCPMIWSSGGGLHAAHVPLAHHRRQSPTTGQRIEGYLSRWAPPRAR
jgi:hypothetical protein